MCVGLCKFAGSDGTQTFKLLIFITYNSLIYFMIFCVAVNLLLLSSVFNSGATRMQEEVRSSEAEAGFWGTRTGEGIYLRRPIKVPFVYVTSGARWLGDEPCATFITIWQDVAAFLSLLFNKNTAFRLMCVTVLPTSMFV